MQQYVAAVILCANCVSTVLLKEKEDQNDIKYKSCFSTDGYKGCLYDDLTLQKYSGKSKYPDKNLNSFESKKCDGLQGDPFFDGYIPEVREEKYQEKSGFINKFLNCFKPYKPFKETDDTFSIQSAPKFSRQNKIKKSGKVIGKVDEKRKRIADKENIKDINKNQFNLKDVEKLRSVVVKMDSNICVMESIANKLLEELDKLSILRNKFENMLFLTKGT